MDDQTIKTMASALDSTSSKPVAHLSAMVYLYSFIGIILVCLAIVAFYRLFLHPLAKFPGPVLWRVSRIPHAIQLTRGNLPHKIAELHDKYGPIVRLAPEELSFISEQAWTDIYTKPLGKAQLKKDPLQFHLARDEEVRSIITQLDDAQHGRIRRNFSHAFSERNIRECEPIMIHYIDKLMGRLRENVGKPIDFVRWINFGVLDFTIDLVFGQSFNCLETEELNEWTSMLFFWVMGAAFIGMTKRFWPLNKIVFALMPKHLKEAEKSHRENTIAFIDNRLKSAAQRPDFITHVQKFLGTPNGLSYDELTETAKVIVAGGAESVVTTLSGVINFLLSNPPTLHLLSSEIHTAFPSVDDINMASTNGLLYLNAVINETLRLLPPVPGNLRRYTPPEGSLISGTYVPGHTLVAVDGYAASHSATNFHRPEDFCPERWLPFPENDQENEFGNDKFKAAQPFSMGPRNCIGKNLAAYELRVFLARLIWTFNFEFAVAEGEHGDWFKECKAYGFWQKGELMVRLTEAIH